MTLPSQPIRLNDIVYATLRQNLEARTLPAGLVIGEAAVASIFGVSRAPALNALQRLVTEALLLPGPKRGFMVDPKGSRPIRKDLLQAGLQLPPNIAEMITGRGLRTRLYPAVEREIAACLPYGLFHINEYSLAQHYGISRTIAHECLVRLERANIVRQRASRWLAGPLTLEGLHEHYEMRWLLEPAALIQAAPLLDPAVIEAAHQRAMQCQAMTRRPSRQRLQALEHDLHVGIVLQCPNREMKDTIMRSQLPLIATNDTFLRRVPFRVPRQMIDEHLAVLAALRDGHPLAAADALAAHLRSALATVSAGFEGIARVKFTPPPYMKREDR
jgi:DNA-binding GntR family transcriptional regulator